MAKQSINVGTTANDKKGDSLRAAFQKVNSNFTELYTALGLNADTTLNLGAFEFNGSVISTTDSTAIVIDQATTVTSDLTVGGDILPSVANGGNLGSLAKPFKSLYVSTNTVFLGGIPLSLDSSNNILVNNAPISTAIEYTSIPNAPTDIADLTDADGLLGGGDTGDITFAATTMSAPNDDAIRIEAKDENGDVRAYFKVDPADGQAEMRALSSPTRANFSLADGDWVSAQWIANGGTGVLEFTNAPNIISYIDDAPSNLYIRINGGAPVSKGSGSQSDNDISMDTGSDFPPSTTVVTTVEFYYMDESRIEIDYDSDIDIYGDQLSISIESTESVYVQGSDVDISASTTLRLQNYADDQNIEIVTDGDDTNQTWAFGVDGTLTLPAGGVIAEGVVTDNPTIELTPANPEDASQKLVIKGGEIMADYHLHLTTGDLELTSIILGTDYHNVRTTTDGNIQITTPTEGTNVWEFDTSGDLTFPDNTVQSTAWTGILPNPTYSGSDEIGEATPAPLNLNNSAEATLLTQLNLINTGGGAGSGSAIDFWTYTSINDVPEVRLQAVDNGDYSADFAIKIKANGNSGNGNLTTTWTFDSDGDLTIPGDIQTNGNLAIRVPSGIPSGVSNINSPGSWDGNGDWTDLATTGGTGTGLVITVTGADGGYANAVSIVTPGTGYTNGDAITAVGESTVTFNITVTRPAWEFGGDGGLTLPGDIVGYQTYFNENPADERVSIQPSGSVDKPFLFTTDQTDGTWERSSMELPSAETNKAVTLGFPHNNITTGYIYNQGTDTLSGTEFNNAFNVMANSTDLKISTVSGGGNKVWKFAQDGDITLPASGDILNSTGVSQLANRVEGSWTVTAGTNTYNFTVPMDGTYVMWVKGNIPNGIITWNATLSVTNSNVPAIGTQYAWNYTGSGNPILLTAIPDQVRGAAGTISTDATYAGSTSNRFDFGISNTSGASQTVYYGYTKI